MSYLFLYKSKVLKTLSPLEDGYLGIDVYRYETCGMSCGTSV